MNARRAATHKGAATSEAGGPQRGLLLDRHTERVRDGATGRCRRSGRCRMAASRVTCAPLDKHSNPLRAPEGALRSSVHSSFKLRCVGVRSAMQMNEALHAERRVSGTPWRRWSARESHTKHTTQLPVHLQTRQITKSPLCLSVCCVCCVNAASSSCM